MFVVAERFLSNLSRSIRQTHQVSTDGGGGTWYPQSCKFLKLDHHINSSYGKSIFVERTIQYIKER